MKASGNGYEREDHQAQASWAHLTRVPVSLWVLAAITSLVSVPTLMIGLGHLKGQPTVADHHHYYAESHGSLISLSAAQYADQVLIGQRLFPSAAAMFLTITAIAAFTTLNDAPTSTVTGDGDGDGDGQITHHRADET